MHKMIKYKRHTLSILLLIFAFALNAGCSMQANESFQFSGEWDIESY